MLLFWLKHVPVFKSSIFPSLCIWWAPCIYTHTIHLMLASVVFENSFLSRPSVPTLFTFFRDLKECSINRRDVPRRTQGGERCLNQLSLSQALISAREMGKSHISPRAQMHRFFQVAFMLVAFFTNRSMYLNLSWRCLWKNYPWAPKGCFDCVTLN